MSYSRRLAEYAWHETREHKKVELIASCIGGIFGGIAAISIVGFMWAGIIAAFVGGFVGLIAALICIFLYHLAHSPKVLDEKQQSEIKELHTCKGALESQLGIQASNHLKDIQELTKRNEDTLDKMRGVQAERDTFERERSALEAVRNSLKAQLDQLNNFKLILDIDTKRTLVRVSESVIGCNPFAGIRMRFDNTDIYRLIMKGVDLTLQERNDAGEVREIESQRLSYKFFLDDKVGELAARKIIEQLPVEDRTSTLYYWLKVELSISSLKPSELIKGKHFLRLTMLAMNQPPFMVDIDVDWRKAMFGLTHVSISHPHLPRT
jgi:hypothetical protein